MAQYIIRKNIKYYLIEEYVPEVKYNSLMLIKKYNSLIIYSGWLVLYVFPMSIGLKGEEFDFSYLDLVRKKN